MKNDVYTKRSEEIAELFSIWKNSRLDAMEKDKPFITDGIVCAEKWFSQQIRPLFLLKEAYGGTEDWDLATDSLLAESLPLGTAWRRLTQWTWAILNTTEQDIAQYEPSLFPTKRGNDMLKSVAVMNIKKYNGKKSSDMDEIREYARHDAEFLYKQLELTDPTVIICGYTISALNEIMAAVGKPVVKDYSAPDDHFGYSLTLNGRKVTVIDYYHPTNAFPDLPNYYGLAHCWQKALQRG